MNAHVKSAGVTWAVLSTAALALFATGEAQHRTVYQPTVVNPTCISQTMEVVPCP